MEEYEDWDDLTFSEEEEDQLMEAWDKELEEHYWNQNIMNGAIPICHEGCAYRQWLIVNGAQKGYVWSDARVDNAGISPILDKQGNHEAATEKYKKILLSGYRIPPDLEKYIKGRVAFNQSM